MVETTLVEEQLKKVGFQTKFWNRAETQELATIILPNEEIFECVNGWYEGGFSLIVSTNIRILLIDKKPFNYLTVEDIRFDMINEIDYSHRLLEARITISTGVKVLTFSSYNQKRLRKLISHVQHRMAEMKHEQTAQSTKQQEHLKQIDQRLQTYLMAQFQQNESLKQKISAPVNIVDYAPVKPLDHKAIAEIKDKLVWDGISYNKESLPVVNGVSMSELYEAGREEVFNKKDKEQVNEPRASFSRLPAMFRHQEFGRALLRGLLIRPILDRST